MEDLLFDSLASSKDQERKAIEEVKNGKVIEILNNRIYVKEKVPPIQRADQYPNIPNKKLLL
jgi:hypothetical protein